MNERHSILVADPLSAEGLDLLRQAGFDVEVRTGLDEAGLAAAVAGRDALIVRSGAKVTATVLAAADRLRVVGRAGIGVDNVDLPAASRRGVVVMNTPTGNAVTTAEHAIALLFALARRLPQACAALKAGRWEKKAFEGRELTGKTLAVIGLGNIGRIVAQKARAFGMNVIGFDPVLSEERASELGIEKLPLDAIWERADAITVHTPLTRETRGLVKDAEIARMKTGVLLVNCARGGIYDEEALLRGLSDGKIGGVALDVFDPEPPPAGHPLVAHERVIVTPHLGASTLEAQDRVAVEIAEQIALYLRDGVVRNAVNVPSVAGDVAARLAPWSRLANRLGRFLAQVEDGLEPRSIEIDCVGEPGSLGIRSIAASALAGFLEHFLATPVNEVSGPVLAADRGIAVRELRSAGTGRRFASLVAVRVAGADGRVRVAEGTLGADGSPRLEQWDEFDVEAHLEGTLLVVTNLDKPGVIGAIGTRLGDARVNVARIHLGLAGHGGAVSIWNLDGTVDETVLATVTSAPNVTSARLVAVQ